MYLASGGKLENIPMMNERFMLWYAEIPPAGRVLTELQDTLISKGQRRETSIRAQGRTLRHDFAPQLVETHLTYMMWPTVKFTTGERLL